MTFGVGRDNAVWVDGSPAILSESSPIKLNGGQVNQIGANTYQLVWNTGEVMTVTNAGDYLNVKLAPATGDTAGSIVGLLALGQTPGNEFELPNGSFLQQPLTSAELQTFANAWRIQQKFSLLDYGPGQTTATFTNTNFPATSISLADLPASVVSQAAQAVAAAGITDPGAAAIAEYDYIASGGDPNVIISDQNAFQGLTINPAQVTQSGPPSAVLGVVAPTPSVVAAKSGTTDVTFNVYLTSAETADTSVNYAVIAANGADLDASAFGGALPSGTITIPTGQTSGTITVDLPQGALGSSATKNLDLRISSSGTTPVFAPTAQTQIVAAGSGAGGIAGNPAVPKLLYLTPFGSFTQNGSDYTLDLGAVKYGEVIPDLQFAIENAASSPADQLTGTLTVSPVAGFSVTGASLPGPLSAGQSYQGINASVTTAKFGANAETITFQPQDTNFTGYSAALPPITLNIADTLEEPGTTYSVAWGDVHIITYNGTNYDFQAVGEFDLAKSRLPGDSFEIQLRLQPWSATSSVSVITQVAAALGSDRVTFDWTRPNPVWVDGSVATLSQANPELILPGGTIDEVTPNMFRVNWNTGETMTVTYAGSYINVVDGVPPGDLAGGVAGLQGEAEGQVNDFQLADGTVLAQPLTQDQLYGEYANSWRVSQASSLFDYAPGQTTATFTDPNFPADRLSLSDLPQNVVGPAAQQVTAAGIADPGIAQAAELDYLATGDPSFITSALNVQQQGFLTVPATVTASTPPAPALGVKADQTAVTESANGTTPVVFDAYLAGTLTADTTVDYAVIAPGAGFFDTTTFGGSLPTGRVTIAAGQTIVPFTIDLPQNALGARPSENLEVQISARGGQAIFAPTAQASVVNSQSEPGAPAIAQLSYIGHLGSFSAIGGAYTLDLGTVPQGQVLPQLQFALSNAATAPADELGGTFSPPSGSGFIIVGNNLASPLIAGDMYQGLYAIGQTSKTGTYAETLTFSPTDINASGYSAALPVMTLTVTETIATPADIGLNTPDTIIFPNVRVGTAESQGVSVSNTAKVPAASLDVTPSANGAATVTGTIATLAPGATDYTDISVGLDTSSGGPRSGEVALNAVSDGGSGGSKPLLPSPMVDVFGGVYRVATASAAPAQAFVHVNDPGTIGLAVMNTDTADGYSENLIASLAGASGGFAAGASGPTPDITAGSSDNTSLGLTFSTAQAGTISGTATLGLVSDGGTGTASVDGLGTIALPAEDVPVAVTVDNYANPVLQEISGGGTFAQNGTDYTLNLGTIAGGSGSLVVNLGALNDITGPADLLSGAFSVSGASAFTTSGFDNFSSIAAGQADTAPMLTLDLSNPGSFAEVIALAPTGSNPSGFSAALPNETLTISATVLPCFARGTRITTKDGEVAVERLRVGDRVITASGATRPVVWIGDREVACRRHPTPENVWPVRVRAGAFGEGLPRRDLLLSPDHAVFQEGVLIPIKHLTDGAGIAQERVDTVHYFHVELESHDVLLAEGLPAESYLDTGNRAMFVGGAAHLVLHPDFAALNWNDACAPLCQQGPIVAAVRRRLRERRIAASGLYVRAGDRAIHPAAIKGNLHQFLLPVGTREVRIGSHRAERADRGADVQGDRRFGVCIAGIVCDGRVLVLDDAAFVEGFWPGKGDRARCRWIDGNARLTLPPAPAGRTARVLELHLRDGMAHSHRPENRARRAG